MMPLLIGKMPKAMAEEKAVNMLKKVGKPSKARITISN